MEETKYLNILNQLYSINKFKGLDLGLDRMYKLLDVLGNPQRAFRSIHVAGTNGKGSVCLKVARSLEVKKQRIGLFTSPHLFTFRERISINGKKISQSQVIDIFSQVLQASCKNDINASFFEILVAAACLYFKTMKVHVAIFEAGIGGTHDATNVLIPIACAITSIGWDHTEILGDTLEKIARDKAGIIKEHIPLALGFHAQHLGIEEIAYQKDCTTKCVDRRSEHFTQDNFQTARVLLSLIEKYYPEIPTNPKGLNQSQPCRFEKRIYQNETLLFDVAHNADGIDALIQQCQSQFPKKKIIAFMTLSEKEGLCNIAKALGECKVALLNIEHPRLSSFEKLQKLFQGKEHLKQEGDLKAFIHSVMGDKNLPKDRIFLFCGSFFMMRDVFEALEFEIEKDPIELNELGLKQAASLQKK